MECKLNGVTMYYEEYGEGRPILIIHGFTPDHRLMSGCMEPVFAQKSGYRRIYPDLPGMGRTKGEDWIDSTDKVLDILIEFIGRAIPEGNFLLAGESYGGYLIRGIAARMKERVDGMLFLCPLIEPERSKRAVARFATITRDEAFIAGLKDEDKGFLDMAVVATAETFRRWKEEVDCGLRLADTPFLQRLRNQYALSFDVDALLGRYEKPTLFLLGKQDDAVGYEQALNLMENYPRATYAILDRAGHNLQIDQPGLFNCLAAEWLDRAEEYNR